MRKTLALALAAVAMLAVNDSAQACRYFGAASYNCCPTTACQPTACYTACRVERKTCYRTVYDQVMEPQQYTAYRTEYETVYEDKQETCYRMVNETVYRDV